MRTSFQRVASFYEMRATGDAYVGAQLGTLLQVVDHGVQHNVQLHRTLVVVRLVEGSWRGERGLRRQQRFGDLAENAQGTHGVGDVTRVVDGDERGVGEQLDVRRRERTYRLLHDGECDVLLMVR